MRRRLISVSLIGCCGCSAASADPKPPQAIDAAAAPVRCDALEAARRAHLELTSKRTPRYVGDGSRTSSLEFFTQELRPWLMVSRRRVQTVEDLYLRSVSACGGDAFKTEAQLQGGLLWKWLGDEALASGRGAFSNGLAGDPEVEAAFIAALTESMRPVWTAAETLLTACGSAQQASMTRDACRTALSGLPKFQDAFVASESAEGACDALAVEPPRATADCVFTGSLWADLELYSAEQGGSALMRTRRANPIHVVRFELPSNARGRIRVDIDSPIAFRGWANAPSGAVSLTEQMELIRDHLWVTPHTPLRAFREGAGFRISATVAEAPTSKEPPWSSHVDCSAITLLGRAADVPPAGELVRLRVGVVTLFAAIAKHPFAALASTGRTTVSVQETQNGWLRVRGNDPFRFDGWVSSEDRLREEPSAIMLREPQCSHVTNAPLPLRMVARLDSPVVAELPGHGQFLVGTTDDTTARHFVDGATSFVDISVPGIETMDSSTHFYVPRELVEKASALLRRE
ncbi:MAG: hypothetical protein QM784_20700 [Polyangiaceae bacterium]